MQIAMKRPGVWRAAAALLLVALLVPPGARGSPRPDDTALYWALARDGQPAGYLLGTIHSEDARVLDFSQAFIDRLAENRTFAMEMVPDLPTLNRSEI